ncbi:MAG: metallophosphoesterase family protein [Gemmatimonadota bacterium]|nr:metallophosphoesterase family protein [Gemmatimonadota bacterium]
MSVHRESAPLRGIGQAHRGDLPSLSGPAYLRPVRCEQLVIVGDAHLGRQSGETESAFLAFLDQVPTLGDGLLITGDLFEFWFTWGRTTPRRGARVAAALAGLRRRVPILFAGGNHDRWGGSYWEQEIGIEFVPEEGRLTVGRAAGLVRHGDGLGEGHWSGRLLDRVTRHPATVAAFGALHPTVGLWLVDRLSGLLGDRVRTDAEIEEGAARQRDWARVRLEADPALGFVVMGHTHRAALAHEAGGRVYLNPGAWFDGYRYALLRDAGASLEQFPA